MVFTGQSRGMHIMAGIFSMGKLYLAGKAPLLVGDMVVNFGDILPETSKSSACWDMGRDSYLTWMSSDSLYLPWFVDLELESTGHARSPRINSHLSPMANYATLSSSISYYQGNKRHIGSGNQ